MTIATTTPRVAIAGTGMIGKVHLDSARAAGAEVVGVLGSSPSRGEDAARRWGVARAFRSLEDALDSGIDVLHVCSPNDTHRDYAVAAMKRGIHVICEKPLAISASDAQQMVEIAQAAGVVTAVPFVYRYHPLVREIRARRIAGEFGELLLAHGSYLQDWLVAPSSSSWRVDAAVGGRSRAFADIGSHWCDLVEFLSGEEIVTVQACTSIAYEQRPRTGGASFSGSATEEMMTVRTEDTAVATFTTARGMLVNTVISQVAAGRKNRLWIELDGSLGSAVFDQENPNSVWLGREDGAVIVQRGDPSASAQQARLNRVPAGHPQGYADAFTAFVADVYSAIRGEAPEGLPTFADGLRAVQLTQAVLDSAQSCAAHEVAAGALLPAL